VRQLKDADVTIAEIARAAGVTHRAISRRLSK
jgi:AcrR family transcriptional regulator